MSDDTRITPQMEVWSGDFGRSYSERNQWSLAEYRERMLASTGFDPVELYRWLLEGVSRSAPILEVGCNVGMQLSCLSELGFRSLHGIELQQYAVDRAAARLPQAEIDQGSALDLPYDDGAFELVYTSGVLIHIHPDDLSRAQSEIHRCSSRFVAGVEYHSEEPQEVSYRGHEDLLWKDDFERRYRVRFDDLETVRSRRVPMTTDPSLSTAYFMLAKPTGDAG